MKIKRTTYGEFNEKFGGLRRLAVNRKEMNMTVGGWLMPIIYRLNICYIKKKDCTYVALTMIGCIDFGGPRNSDLTIVCKFDGNLTEQDLIKKDFIYKDELKAIEEELYNKWNEDLHKEES